MRKGEQAQEPTPEEVIYAEALTGAMSEEEALLSFQAANSYISQNGLNNFELNYAAMNVLRLEFPNLAAAFATIEDYFEPKEKE